MVLTSNIITCDVVETATHIKNLVATATYQNLKLFHNYPWTQFLQLFSLKFANKVDSDIEIDEDNKNTSVENRIENPGTNSITATFEKEMNQEKSNMTGHVTPHQHNLAVQDEWKTSRSESDCSPESVTVNQRVDEGREEDRENLKGLREF
ncbi:unnamed protein product [Vicia faba]|uniref:Uncharacterized protein n=1 Tax=Vicia faba TaxID=3906 RepID=A0AAV1AJ67_VICFA|nr:unnamed protein product [Vicia faba]